MSSVEHRVTCAGLFQYLGYMNLLVFSIYLWKRQPVTSNVRVTQGTDQSKSPGHYLEIIGAGMHPDSFVTDTELRAPSIHV